SGSCALTQTSFRTRKDEDCLNATSTSSGRPLSPISANAEVAVIPTSHAAAAPIMYFEPQFVTGKNPRSKLLGLRLPSQLSCHLSIHPIYSPIRYDLLLLLARQRKYLPVQLARRKT